MVNEPAAHEYMVITICGGGSAAHTLTAVLAEHHGISVRLYTPHGNQAERLKRILGDAGSIAIKTPDGERAGRPQTVSRYAGEVVPGAELVILALPAFAHENTLREIAPFLEPGAWVGAMPARGGFDLAAEAALGDAFGRVSVFGLQTLPWACRVQAFGRRAVVLGAKECVDVAAEAGADAGVIAARLERLVGVPMNPISSFLELTLADTGQIIHPGIMCGLFEGWDGRPLPAPIPFYRSVDAAIADRLECMSAEVQNLRAFIENRWDGVGLAAVRPLREWMSRCYRGAIVDHGTLQSQFNTNRCYAGLVVPMRPVAGGFVPDFASRYLTEDVPFNLLATRGIAELAGVSMPAVDRVIAWAQDRLGRSYLGGDRLAGADIGATRSPQRYGISSLRELLQPDMRQELALIEAGVATFSPERLART